MHENTKTPALQFVLVLLFTLGGGVFSIFCAVMDYDWFIRNERAEDLLELLGREGTRTFYIVVGIVLVLIGLLYTFKLVPMVTKEKEDSPR